MTNTHKLNSLVELETQINNRIAEFEGKSSKNKKYNQLLKYTQILLAALTLSLIHI